MIKEFIEKWNKYGFKLEKYFKETEMSKYSDYIDILKAIIDLVINSGLPPNDEYGEYSTEKITEIDDGDYQGMKLFIIPKNTYQPWIDEYLFTYVDYGSCEGCDTLLGIMDYKDGLPTEDQVKDFMTLALHLIERMKRWVEIDEENDRP